MAVLKKTPEERAARDEQKKQQQAAKQQQKQRDAIAKADAQRAKRLGQMEQAFWGSPRGQARSAKYHGQRYFQIEMPLVETARTTNSWLFGDVQTRHRKHGGQGAVLTEIEYEGWELIEAGFVYHHVGAVSRDKLLSSGQSIQTTGHTMGVYLFRATDDPVRKDRPWVDALRESEGLALPASPEVQEADLKERLDVLGVSSESDDRSEGAHD